MKRFLAVGEVKPFEQDFQDNFHIIVDQLTGGFHCIYIWEGKVTNVYLYIYK